MNILYGLYGHDSGEILVNGKRMNIQSPQEAITNGIGMVHQEFMLVRPFTVAENVALGLSTGRGPLLDLDQVREKVRDISIKYGLAVDPDAKVEHLSVGVQQRAEIVKLLVRDAHLLILDEPTAVLVPQEIEGLFKILRLLVKDGRAVVFITHKLNEVMAAADRITVLRDGKSIATVKTYETNPQELARLMVGRDVLFKTLHQGCTPGESILNVEDLHVLDDKRLPAVKGISFSICEGEILGVAGVDGNGQAQLAEALAGMRPASGGRILLSREDVTRLSVSDRHTRGMGYIPADRREVGCIQSLDIAKNSILGRTKEFSGRGAILLDAAKIRKHAEDLVSTYDIRTPNIRVLSGKLSGGNLQKLLLGRELSRDPKVLIIEQPSRGLDVGATEFIHSKIIDARQNNATVLLISSELDEILNLCDRIIVIYEGKIMGTLQGGEIDIETIGLMMAGVDQTHLSPKSLQTESVETIASP